MASQTLEVMRHNQGPLLDLFLTPMMSSLTFKEVVNCILNENRHRVEHLLDDLLGCCAQIHEELDDLAKAHREEPDKSSQKRIKKDIDMRLKDLESLRVAISHNESNLEQDQSGNIAPDDDYLSGYGVREATEAEVAPATEADNTPSRSAATQSSDPPPAEGQACAMEVDKECSDPPPASPISPADNNLLTGGGSIRVEADLAHLTVSSTRGPDGTPGEGEEASI